MPEKPNTAAGYLPDQVERVKSTCLYLATKFGDLMDDLVVVGGLVPALLVDQESLPSGASSHVGTLDLDLGLSFALVGEERYQAIAERLREAEFTQDVNEKGNVTRQRWRVSDPAVMVDFLIEPENAGARPGGMFSLTSDLAAMVTPGLHLAFKDNQVVTIRGRTIMGEEASRDIRVCGAGAYMILKALAVRKRGKRKDAYDLFYVLRNYGRGVSDVAEKVRSLLPDKSVEEALAYLRDDFGNAEAVGPMRVAAFLYGRPDAAIQADAVGFIRELLQELGLDRNGAR